MNPLVDDVTYYWQVRTINNGYRCSEWSSISSTYVPPIPPSAIANLTSMAGKYDDEIKLRWTATGENLLRGAIVGGEYWVKYSSDAAHNWDSMTYGIVWSTDTMTGSIESRKLTDLTAWTTYYIYLKTKDAHNNWSNLSNKTTCYPVHWTPLPITTLTATRDFQIKLTWKAPDNGFGGKCDTYLLKYSSSGNISSESAFINANTYYQTWTPAAAGTWETKYLLGLQRDTTYWFSIKSASNTIWSCYSTTGTNTCMTGTFGDMLANISNVYSGAMAWGDYNNDGILDLAMCGAAGSPVAKVYTNNGNDTFTDSGNSITGVYNSSIKWGDYDNDGWLDLAICGWTGDTAFTKIYHNNNGVLTDIGAGLSGANNSTLAWADYDNDGFLDLTVAGNNGADYFTKIYQNNSNGTFTQIEAGIIGMNNGGIAWGDYDNDGYLDLALTGWANTAATTKLYKNNNGLFTDSGESFDAVYNSALAFGDYDNDGWLDLAVAGNTGGGVSAKIYKNTNGTFSDSGKSIIGVKFCSLTWGDFNNDGYLDLGIAGDTGSGTPISKIYTYNGSNFIDTNSNIVSVKKCSMALGDYNNSGDLDLAICGDNGSGGISKIYKSYEQITNPVSTPTVPSAGLSCSYNKGTNIITMSWDTSTDAKTASPGLYYGIRCGTTTPVTDYNSICMSWKTGRTFLGNYPHGYRTPGQQSGFLMTPILDDTTYYWQVCAIDPGFCASDWSSESDVYIPLIPPLAITSLESSKGKYDDQIDLKWIAPGNSGIRGDITGGKYWVKYSSTATDSWEEMIYEIVWDTNTSPGNEQYRTCSGLIADNTYFFYVKTQDQIDNNWSELSNKTTKYLYDTVAPCNITDLVAYAGIKGDEMLLTWTAPGDNGIYGAISGGTYQVNYSTNAQFAEAVNEILITTTMASERPWQSRLITGLAGFSTYYFKMRTRDEIGLWSIESNTATCYNLGTPKLYAIPFCAVSTGTVQVNWTSNNVQSQYYCEGSTISPYTTAITSSGWVSATYYFFTYLQINTTYGFRVKARDPDRLIESPWLTVGATSTWSVEPAADVFNDVTKSSIRPNWTQNGNPQGTQYNVQESTSNDFGTIKDQYSILLTSCLFTSLDANTTYWYRVRAINDGSYIGAWVYLGPKVTLSEAVGGQQYTNLLSTAVTVNFGKGTNPVGTTFVVEKHGDSGYNTLFQSSSTYNEYAQFITLDPNTTSWYRVKAVNYENIPTSWTNLGSKVTLCNPPVAQSFSEVGKLSIKTNWTHNFNSTDTLYNVQRSTWNGFLGTVVEHTLTGLSKTFTNLVPSTEYWFRVKGINHESISSDWTSLGNIATLVKQPGPVTDLRARPYMRPGWVKLEWTAPGSDGYTGTATSYIVKYATFTLSNDAEYGLAETWPTGAPKTAGNPEELVISGLEVNYKYYFGIKSIEEYGAISFLDDIIPRPSTYTADSGVAFYVDIVNGNDTYEGSLMKPWKTMSKVLSSIMPGDWVYMKDGNYNGAITINAAISGKGDRKTRFIGVNVGKAKIAAEGDSITIQGSSVTIEGISINSPLGAGISLNSGISDIEIRNNVFYGCEKGIVCGLGGPSQHHRLKIVANVFNQVTSVGIILRNDAGSVDANKALLRNNIFYKGNAIIVAEGNATVDYDINYNDYYSASFVGMEKGDKDILDDPLFADVANQDYHLKSKTGRWNGTAWVRDTVQSPCIDTGDPSVCLVQPSDGKVDMGIYGGLGEESKSYQDMVITLETMQEPSGTSVTLLYTEGAVRYRIERSANQIDWIALADWDTNITTNAYTDTNLTPATTYYYRVSAYNDLGAQDNTYSNILKVVTQTLRIGIFYIDNVVNVDSGVGNIKVTIPAGTVGENFYIEVKSGKTATGVKNINLESNNGVIIESGIVSIKLFSVATLDLISSDFGSKEALIEIPYVDSDGDNIEDTTGVPIKRLTGHKYVNDKWTALDSSKVETVSANRRIKIRTNSFSIYGTGGKKYASDLNTFIAYPNPWKPNSGGIFSGAIIIFDNLTKDCKIKVFDLAGTMWLDTEIDSTCNGRYVWNGKNSGGEDAGSGTYYYVLTNSVGENKKGIMTIIR
ncbi:MAG: FG-GAP-like repeat-containing protein [Elusimicrobiota bacterium]